MNTEMNQGTTISLMSPVVHHYGKNHYYQPSMGMHARVPHNISNESNMTNYSKPLSISPQLKKKIKDKMIDLSKKGELDNYKLDSSRNSANVVYGIIVNVNLEEETCPPGHAVDKLKKHHIKSGDYAFAVKHIQFNEYTDNAHKVLFERELNALHHTMGCRQCVALLGKFEIKDDHYLIFEYMDAGSLRFILNQQKDESTTDENEGMDEALVAEISYQVLKGLAFLESQGIVHRDIKPANLLVKGSGSVKIGDFGLCNKVPHATGEVSTFLGTPLYMAPERQLNHDYSFPSDIWAFGIVAYELATGYHPDYFRDMISYHDLLQYQEYISKQYFTSPQICKHSIKFNHTESSKFSDEFKQFLKKCVHIDPTQRASAAELLQEPFIRNYFRDGKKRPTRQRIRKFLKETCHM